MKKIRLYCLAALVLLGTLLAATAAAGAQAVGYQSVRGIEVEFTPSPRTGRYRFEVYEAGSQEAVCSKSFDSITRAQTVFLPVECLPEKTYTIKVTDLPEPGREGLDVAASKEQAFIPQPVCGHTAAEGGFLWAFQTIFPKEAVKTAMVVSRGISFYLFLILSFVVCAFVQIRVTRAAARKKKSVDGQPGME